MTTTATLAFPEGFAWGAATAAHQVEGNTVNNDWWAREHTPGSGIAEPSGDACDSYHRYREDMALLADAGLNAYRFSLEWSRIEPEEGFVSRAAIDHYRRMVAACHEFGLTPMVTMLHFTVPRWMDARGGWRHPDAVDRFARFTEFSLPIVADGVDWVCTINEPNIVSMIHGRRETDLVASGLPAPDEAISEVMRQAHVRSRQVLGSAPALRTGWSVATQAFHAEPGCEQQTRDYGYPREDFFLDAARGDDWVGVQAYTRTFIGPDGPRPIPEGTETTLTGWEYFPPALGIGVRNAWARTGGVPVFVTENGIATADDQRRIDYTRGALTGLHQAMSDGVDVLGYLHWSALDNYEWGSYRPTFGLIAWDRQTFARHPKNSLGWLGRVARANALGPADERVGTP
ncbi:glycoside hydrolase family 1 protein [Nakamurella multipartita]|uniref:Glycoside hydrolase family 1 n=1 Tax=Nakamurella multipartita (strain ATCC 700099 / DSM 44233 / CIP 104796 / JCM 9543 / NBRC 105858 / Y-104) TaxID=479431 RepID=C8X761_NAKMY|nr:family 1 glycosylhydrolase [Nakamurella multipartita]ACV76930.1 glycoside hydrolase family 1 [Nakamurella multipartita DSM 44233]